MDYHKELKTHFGFSGFNNGQEEVITRVLQGESAAAVFPTGGGKSLCYQLPALLLPGVTLVVSPLLALMYDQLDFLKKKGVSAAVLDSTLTHKEYQDTVNSALKGELKILMISVERFKNERFRGVLSLMHISLLVVDEAHCISEWGHNFRPEYLKLPRYKEEFSIPQVLLLTATATETVAEDMCQKLGIKEENCIRTGFYRENLHLEVTPVHSDEKEELLLNRLKNSPGEPAIVYVTLQKTAEEIADILIKEGINAACYHGGMKSDDRSDVQNRFMDGVLDCIVATIAFGMGIDKRDIRHVIHFDLPKSIENYSQEAGRAGRDGLSSRCELFACGDGLTVLENFVYGDTPLRGSIYKLLEILLHSGPLWEIQLYTLSGEVDIRTLPLKTLLVYLEIEGIISSAYSYFASCEFKALIPGKEILLRFEGERREFLKTLFSYTEKKRVWVQVKLEEFVRDGGERQRALKALEFLNSEGLIELRTGQSVEVYKKTAEHFDIQDVTDRIYRLFKHKEESEIKRIRAMVDFFESKSCLAGRLSGYFGENKEGFACGDCSVCKSRPAQIISEDLPLPSPGDFQRYFSEFSLSRDSLSLESITRFFCGISTPLLTRQRASRLPDYGLLARYPYNEVKRGFAEFFSSEEF